MSRTAAAPMPSEVTLDVASADGLYAALDRIAVEGWDGPTAHTVLAYARDDVVRPQVARARLRGAVADQACGTGWEVAWEVLTGLGPVRSPWGVVATAVRRAVLGEVVAAMYATDARSAWRLRADAAADDGSQRLPRSASRCCRNAVGSRWRRVWRPVPARSWTRSRPRW